MTAATNPETIPTTQGDKMRQCPHCGHEVAIIYDGPFTVSNCDEYWCSYCEAEGWVLDLPDAPDPELRPRDPRIGAALRSAGRDARDDTFEANSRSENGWGLYAYLASVGITQTANNLMMHGGANGSFPLQWEIPTLSPRCEGVGSDGFSPCYGVRGYCPDHG